MTVILIGGHQGVGKRTLAHQINKRVRGTVLDTERLTTAITETLLTACRLPVGDRRSDDYLAHIRPVEQEATLSCAEMLTKRGQNVVCISDWEQQMSDENLRAAIVERFHGTRTIFIWTHCDEDMMRLRLATRGMTDITGNGEEWRKYWNGLGSDKNIIDHADIVVNTSQSPSVDTALKQITHLA